MNLLLYKLGIQLGILIALLVSNRTEAYMQYTLFIDESGHFGHEDNPTEDWVVGGVLYPSGPRTAEKTVGNRLNPIPSQFGLEGRYDLHRTELNDRAVSSSSEWTFQRVKALSKSLFRTVLGGSAEARFVAVRNPSQRELSNPEETYRLMLVDLIALADSVLPPDRAVDSLHLCVARRKRESEKELMTTRRELGEYLQKVVGAIEVDLASRGVASLLHEDELSLRKQSDSWLLTVADFWCNAVYNSDKQESAAVVEALLDQGFGRVFTSWAGDVRVRRALVAERDRNRGLALYRWAVLAPSDHPDKSCSEALSRLCERIASASRNPRPTFEQAIEMLWRHFGMQEQYEALITALRRIESAVESAAEEMSSTNGLLFRIRNMIHLAANRDGLTELALQTGEAQKDAETEIGYDPEYFSLLLDSQLYRIHTLHHNLEFAAGLEEAEKHRERVDEYGALWDLFGNEQERTFESSRMNLKAAMTWIESRIRAADLDAPLNDVMTEIESLRGLPMADYDRSRLLNHSILARLKQGWWDGALDESSNSLGQSTDQYALAHAARAAASAVLKSDAHHQKAEAIHGRVQQNLPENQTGVFPALTRRDMALLTHILDEDLRAARLMLREGRSTLTWSPDEEVSPIRKWVSWTFDLTGRLLSKGDEMLAEVPSNFRGVIPDTNTISGRSDLLSVRRASPY